jgi:hypothetical protein
MARAGSRNGSFGSGEGVDGWSSDKLVTGGGGGTWWRYLSLPSSSDASNSAKVRGEDGGELAGEGSIDEGASNRGMNANRGLGREFWDECVCGFGGGRQGVSWGRALNVMGNDVVDGVDGDDVDDIGGGEALLHEYVSGSKGKRPIGTLFRSCACCRFESGSGIWRAVGKER